MTDPGERDRTLARVRTTTAVTGIGALVTGGVLAAWLGHVTAADQAATTSGSTSTSTGTSGSTGTDDGLTAGDAPSTADQGSTDQQPPVTSGGS